MPPRLCGRGVLRAILFADRGSNELAVHTHKLPAADEVLVVIMDPNCAIDGSGDDRLLFVDLEQATNYLLSLFY